MKSFNSIRFSVVMIFVLCIGATVHIAKAATNIIADGKPGAQIVIAEAAPRSVKLAASELQAHLEKITGAKLPIVTTPASDQKTVNIYVGQSKATDSLGLFTKGLPEDGAYRIVSGDNWLALIGQDADFVPREPWGRNRNDWLNNKLAKWDEMTGEYWSNEMGQRMWVDYNRELDLWDADQRGSLNAVYGYLRSLGVRWYMPGELGTLYPELTSVKLQKMDQTVKPDVALRKMSFARYAQVPVEDILWSLRLGNNAVSTPMHHGMRNISRREEQRKKYPEIYSLVNGKRDNESSTPNNCLSSKVLFDQQVRYVRTMFDVYDVPIVSVMPDDGFTVICQCDECKGQATISRGNQGWYSDYVWDYVNRVAKEVGKTHPDRKITCMAYSTYRLPPEKIAKLEPNILVCIVGGRPVADISDTAFEEANELRKQWREKSVNKIGIFMNYPFTQRGNYQPQYFPHIIARGIHEQKGDVWYEDIWIPERRGLYQPGMNHLNAYVMAAAWWDSDLDVEALLKEYYTRYYGPAAAPMKAFIEYSEANYMDLTKDGEKIQKALALFDAAKAAADPDSVYGQRIALVDPELKGLRNRVTQLGKGRENVPEFAWALDMKKDSQRDSRDTLVMDGKIDEPFWTGYMHGAQLVELQTGKKSAYPSMFYVRWHNDNLYFAIRCKDKPGRRAKGVAEKDGDPVIWSGDHVEILLETNEHSYYQIVISPEGKLVNLDRGMSKKDWFGWSSEAEVATHVEEGEWSVEIRIPVTPAADDPLHAVSGRMPSKTLPWYFNICRARFGDDGLEEQTAWSPTGSKQFHDVMKFGRLHIK